VVHADGVDRTTPCRITRSGIDANTRVAMTASARVALHRTNHGVHRSVRQNLPTVLRRLRADTIGTRFGPGMKRPFSFTSLGRHLCLEFIHGAAQCVTTT
jgi:hypothetical protein